MKLTKKFRNKCMVTVLTAALAVSGAGPVWAADSTYKDTERAALKSLISDITSGWDDSVKKYEENREKGAVMKLTLKAEDTGRAMLGALLGGMDMSWLQSVSLEMNASLKDSKEAALIKVLLNDSQICDINMFMDLMNLTEYFQIPELSEGYLSVPLNFTTDGEEISEDVMQTYFRVLSDLSSVMPEASQVEALLDCYGNIIIDHMDEGSTTDQTLSVEGIEEDCTVYEGILSEENGTAMVKEILTAAKDDEEIKALITQWEESTGSSGQYEKFESSVNGMLDEIGDADEDGDISETEESTEAADTQDTAENTDTDGSAAGTVQSQLLTSEVWVNADGQIKGRKIGNDDFWFTWQNPSADGSNALLLEFGSSDSDSITFTGTGTSSGGVVNGDYMLAVNGVKSAYVTVENLKINAKNQGYPEGTLHVTFPGGTDNAAGTDSEESTAGSASGILSSLGIDIVLTGDEAAETGSADITVTMSGAELATLTLTAGYGDGVEVPDMASLTPAYDTQSDESIAEYLSGVNWDTLLNNLTAAGLPEELAQQLQSALEASAESTADSSSKENTDSAIIGGSDGSTEIDLVGNSAA